jgi:hypothetical protein
MAKIFLLILALIAATLA